MGSACGPRHGGMPQSWQPGQSRAWVLITHPGPACPWSREAAEGCSNICGRFGAGAVPGGEATGVAVAGAPGA